MLLLLLFTNKDALRRPIPGGSATASVELQPLQAQFSFPAGAEAGVQEELSYRTSNDVQTIWETVQPVATSSGTPSRRIQASAAYDNTGDVSEEALSNMVEALLLEQATAASGRQGLRIVIESSAYRLTVFRDDQIVCSMPVGLGRGAATPAGSYYIANKITNPVWYNRGNPVAGGDPENPLGQRWLGLGQAGQTTPLGMHPTAEEGSIGQPMSRGCVRLLPADAEALFRLCPLFTPVQILP